MKKATSSDRFLIALLVTPFVFGVLVVSVIPTLLAFFSAFTDLILGFNVQWHFIGLQNFIDSITNDRFISSFRIGTIWAVSVTTLSLIIGMVIALLIQRNAWYSSPLKFLAMFPWALSPVVVAIIWEIVLSPKSGPVNGLLRLFHLPGKEKNLLGDFTTALPTVIVVGTWIALPVVSISLLASLKTLRPELLEAATIDGAESFQKFRNVVLPHLRPIITALFALNIIWNFNSFGLIYVLTAGGPGGQTYLPALFVYNESFKYGNFGYGAAMGVIITISLVIILGIYVKIRSRNEVEA